MAESQEAKTLSLSERYELKGKDENVDADTKPVEVKEAESPVASEPVAAKPEEPPAAVVESTEATPTTGVEESSENSPSAVSEDSADAEADPPAAEEESSDSADNTAAKEEEAAEEAPELKLETAPVDLRFPTTNQTRHCFSRYVEYHRCVAVKTAKDEDTSACNKFQRYYRSLCPDEWIERWNEQRENGTFPGPL